MAPDLNRVATGSAGSTNKTTYMPDIEQLRVPLPPIHEQQHIADFLDAQTARTDRLVSLRTQQLTVALEKLRATAEVTTGRTELRAMDLPDHAHRVPLRRALSSIGTGATPPDLASSVDGISNGMLPWYTPAAIDDALSLKDADKSIDANRSDFPIFPAGSVLVTGIGESLGKVAYLDHDATGNQRLTALRPSANTNGRFLAWQLWAAQDEIREWAQYSRIRVINNDTLKEFPIYLPGRSTQDAAAHSLDSQLLWVRRLRTVVRRFGQLMVERRQALITAAVTGQFDVSTAAT